MNTLIRVCVVVLYVSIFSACVSSKTMDQAPVSEFMQKEVHSVDGSLYIGPQPKNGDFTNLKSGNISHVVNFRTPAEMEKLDFNEADELAALNIGYSSIPVGGDEHPYGAAQLKTLGAILAEHDGKVLLHCGSGYRASVFAVAWLVKEQGLPLDQALEHAEGWWPLRLQEVMGQEYSLVPK